MVDITEIKDQHLGALIADHCECSFCGIVDRDPERTRVGYPCPNCKREGDGGETYFHLGIVSTINLIQEFYHTPGKHDLYSVGSHKLAVVVFFCTLVETLLENILRERMCAQKIHGQVQERLLSDNLTSKQRTNKLFPALFNNTWKEAVAKAARAQPKMDYPGTLDYFLKVVKARNRFLHPPGSKWAIGLDMPRQCLRRIPSLLGLFVWLHNHYVAKGTSKE